MNLIHFKLDKSISTSQLINLYSDAGWSAYTCDIDRLERGIVNSLDVITAWDDAKLVGLIRTIGDSETIIYIQDIIVLKEYKRHKIGSQLMQKITDKYKEVRQIVLLTQDEKETRGFYESIQFESYDQGQIVAFGMKSKG